MSTAGARALFFVIAISGTLCCGVERARAQKNKTVGDSAEASTALFRLDPLGVDQQVVLQLDALLRMELRRLLKGSMPPLRTIRLVLGKNPRLAECTGELHCLVRLGKLFGVQRIISGNVGGLADQYVLNLKLVDVKQAQELRRIQEAISEHPDQLIETVRVAAYRLVAPDRLRGSLEVLANVPGASVRLDGRLLGQTPLPQQHGLMVGEHALRVSKSGYTDVVQKIHLRLQKTARVVLTLQAPAMTDAKKQGRLQKQYPWYTRWWFWGLVGAAAVGTGVALGLAFAGSPHVDCTAEPTRCGL